MTIGKQMLNDEDSKTLILASFYFNELFKRAVMVDALPVAVTKTQMDLLMSLYAKGASNMSALSERVGIAPEQTTRAMKGLREQGLVETERDEDNRRMVIATLTDKGVLMLDELMREQKTNLQVNLEGLNPEESEQLVEAAKVAISLLRKTGIKHVVPDSELSSQA